MAKMLSGMKVAALVANGFCQEDLVGAQRAMIENGANLRIVSSENGLVNGWQNDGWGHHFAVDTQINTALAADFDALVIPAGGKSCDKLRLTAHTRRFINGFLSTGKPVFMMGESVGLLVFTEGAAGRTVSCPEDMTQMMETAGAEVAQAMITQDGNMISCVVSEQNRAECMNTLSRFFAEWCEEQNEAQAA